MSKRQSKRNPGGGAGCLQQVILVGMVGALLMYGSNAPTNGNAGVAPWLFWSVVLVGVGFIVACWRGRVGFTGVLIAMAIGAALIFLNGTDAMPLVGNPCPGDEIIIVVGGQCRGMDADANRSWLDRMVGK